MDMTAQSKPQTPSIKDLALNSYAPAAIPGVLAVTALAAGVPAPITLISCLLVGGVTLPLANKSLTPSTPAYSFATGSMMAVSVVAIDAAVRGGGLISTVAAVGAFTMAATGSILASADDVSIKASFKRRFAASVAGMATSAALTFAALPETPAQNPETPVTTSAAPFTVNRIVTAPRGPAIQI